MKSLSVALSLSDDVKLGYAGKKDRWYSPNRQKQ
jgi:hypothetical protein